MLNEKKRVARGCGENVLTVRGLSKVYHSRKTGKHLVVDQLSWGVPAGECFGLLGVNGAGIFKWAVANVLGDVNIYFWCLSCSKFICFKVVQS